MLPQNLARLNPSMIEGSATTDGPPERDDVLAMLGETMEYVRDRIDASDPETLEEERLCIQWVRALGYLAGQVRMLKSDADLDEMEDELELLERARKLQEGR